MSKKQEERAKRYSIFCRKCRTKEKSDTPITVCQKCGSELITLNDHRGLYSYIFPFDRDKFNDRRVDGFVRE